MAKTIALAVMHQGHDRRHNEDNLYFLDHFIQAALNQSSEFSASGSGNPQFFAVADGMGGAGIGDLAAQTVMRALDQQRRSLRPGFSIDFTNFARDTVDLANRRVCEQLTSYEGLRVGTTFSFLVISQDTVYSVSLGNSRIYLFRDSQLQRLTEDHISQLPDRYPLGRHLGFLTDSAVLQSDNLSRTVLNRGDILLLMTDGVSDILDDEQIRTELLTPLAFVQQIRNVQNLAIQQGSHDDMTLIGIKIIDPNAAEPAKQQGRGKRWRPSCKKEKAGL